MLGQAGLPLGDQEFIMMASILCFYSRTVHGFVSFLTAPCRPHKGGGAGACSPRVCRASVQSLTQTRACWLEGWM